MKKFYLLFLASFVSIYSFSQTAAAVVFSEAGEKFTLFLNGEKQNATPQTNIKLSNLTSEFYQARVDFEDASIPDFSNNNFAVQKGIESTYIIKKNKKGEYVLRFHSQTEMSGSASAAQPSSVEQSKKIAAVDDEPAAEEPAAEPASGSVTMNAGGAGVGANTTVTQTTTTTTTAKPKPATGGEKVNIGMNVGGVNMGMNVNIQDDGMNMDTEVEESATVVQTTRTTTTTTTTAKPAPQPMPAAQPRPAPKEELPAQPQGRCASSMSTSSFASAKSNIESKSFEDSKLTVAKQVTKANCLTAEQVAQVMALFSFEETKLEYAKYAYDFCYNQGDYYVVNEAFTFESSIDELNKFLESK